MNFYMFKLFLVKFVVLMVVVCSVGVGVVLVVELVKIVVINWVDVFVVVNVVKYVFEMQFKQLVQFVQVDIGIQYQGVVCGDFDIMVGGWLLVIYGVYYVKYKSDLDDVGIIYIGGKNGWVVLIYILELELLLVVDLNKLEVKSKLSGMIQGIELGGGLMQVLEKMIKVYNLDGYNFQVLSEVGMLVSVLCVYQLK